MTSRASANVEAVVSFEQALAMVADGPRPHVLMGNGFSIAWRPGIFTYEALLDSANFQRVSVDGRALFRAISTADFERVIRALRQTALLIRLYDSDVSELAGRLERDAEAVKDELARVIAERHPDVPGAVLADEYASAARFLAHFDRLYTVNYDLLLYWTVMNAAGTVSEDDGFRNDPDDAEAEYVTWDSSGRAHTQRLFYLHGALHLFDEGDRLTKFTWIRTQLRLIDQVRSAMSRDAFPLVVTEGASAEKLTKIQHHAYLSHCFRSFAHIGGTLFVFGHGIGEQDLHVLRLIARNRALRRVFVSVRGAPSTELQQRLSNLTAMRPRGYPALAIRYYDADSAHVWR